MKPWLKILIGLVLGIVVGLIVGRPIEIFSMLGKVFIDLLKMLVGIIVFASLVSGICHINDPKKLGRIGIRTLLFYAITTVIAAVFGIILAFIIKPGVNLNFAIPERVSGSIRPAVGILDFLFSIIPSNPFAAFAEGNILQIIVFSILFAFAITLSKEKGKLVLNYIESLCEVMYELTHFVMKLAPYGVFALMAYTVSSIGFKIIWPLILFLVCNYIACLLQIFFIFGGALKYLAKLKVAPFFKGMKDAIVLAFTTSSSSATLPVSLECAREHLGVSADISGFVMSLGSTINMNGAAIGQAISAIFIAQVYGIQMTLFKLVILIVTSLISAVGAAGIPGTGLIMLSIVLNAIGLPLEGIVLVAGVDRLREMMSSVVNVLGDAVTAVFIAKKENQINEKQYHAVTWLE